MKDGFIKVGASSIEISVADPEKNAERIIAAVRRASQRGIALLCLPELCLCGYSCGDLFFFSTLIAASEEQLFHIAEATKDCDTVFTVGLPIVHFSKLYNCVAVIAKGEILGLVPKTEIPGYGEFYEYRQFSSGKDISADANHTFSSGVRVPFSPELIFVHETLPDFSFGVEICEELWVQSPKSERLCRSGAKIVLNPSASDEVIGKERYRRELVTGASARLICGYVYADAAPSESTQDLVFSSHHLIAENGALLAENPPFEDEMIASEIDVARLAAERRKTTTYHEDGDGRYVTFSLPAKETELTRPIAKNPFIPAGDAIKERCELILKIQAHGLKKRIEHVKAGAVVIGVSGGLDSTLALIVAAKAMDLCGRSRRDIIAVTMPCFGTTARTRSNAEKLCEAYGISFEEINITDAVREHFYDIGHPEQQHDVTYENSQARERTQVLMDIANRENGIVVGTGDLSELALGWCTYNGDHMSMYGVNASVPKTLVKYLVRYEAIEQQNAGREDAAEVLFDILDTPVSPELLPPDAGEISQKTEELVGPYELHDFFLYYTLRFGFSPKKILRMAMIAYEGTYDAATVKKWLCVFIRRFFSQQFKRSCMPDGVKVGTVTLSPRGDLRMPSDADCSVFLKEAENADGDGEL